MDTKYFQYFLKIAETGNMTKAAEELFVSQSTLSQFIQRQETELGAKLFVRSRNQLALTPVGHLYLETCKNILSQSDVFYRELSNLKQSKTGNIFLGLTQQWGGWMFAKIYPDFIKEFPEYTVTLVEDYVVPLQDMLKKNAIDVAVLPFITHPDSSLPYKIVYEEEFLLAVPRSWADPEYVPGELAVVSLKKFADRPFMTFCADTVMYEVQYRQFDINGLNPNVRCQFNNIPATYKLVESGVAAAIMPASFTKSHPNIAYFRLDTKPKWVLVIANRKGFHFTAADKYLCSLISDYLNDQPVNMLELIT